MVDKVIVTLIFEGQEFDIEISANTKVGKMKSTIAQALRQKGLLLSNSFQLICNGSTLSDSDTLFQLGVWDGSYIEVI